MRHVRQITLRGIPDEVEIIAQEEAKSRGVSLNKAFLSLLAKGAEQEARHPRGKKRPEKSDFAKFLGLWSEEEGTTFEESLHEQRKIDEELWS